MKQANEFTWFNRWIIEGYSVRQLSAQSGHSYSKLRRIIQYWLDNPPEPGIDLSHLQNMVFDGTFVHGRKSIVAVMDGQKNLLQTGEYGIQENSIPQLTTFFLPLVRNGLCPQSATVDGNPQVIRLFQAIWPNIVIQRCLVHIQRQGLMWCRRFPKRTDAKHLRRLFRQTTYIRTTAEQFSFQQNLNSWESRFGNNINVKPESGKVFSDVKRARSMLLKALPNMFHYLYDPQIPASTNSLEGYFSRLKANYRQHRGLSPRHRKAYFRWYFHLKNK